MAYFLSFFCIAGILNNEHAREWLRNRNELPAPTLISGSVNMNMNTCLDWLWKVCGHQHQPVAQERDEWQMESQLAVGRTRTTATGDFWLCVMDRCLFYVCIHVHMTVYIYIYIHIYMYTLLPGKLHDTRLWCIDWKLGLQVAFWRLRRKGVWINSRFLIKIPHELALRVIVTSSFRLFQLLFTLLSPLFEPRISLPPAKRGG